MFKNPIFADQFTCIIRQFAVNLYGDVACYSLCFSGPSYGLIQLDDRFEQTFANKEIFYILVSYVGRFDDRCRYIRSQRWLARNPMDNKRL